MKKFLVTLLALMMLCSSAFAAETADVPVLTIGIPQNTLTTDYEENKLTIYMEELAGVELDFMIFPSDSTEAKQKLSLMVASGEKLPDILWNFGLSDIEKLDYGSSGYLVPLNDYITPEFATNWYATMEKWGTETEIADLIKYGTSPDGNIYGWPAYQIDPGDATALGMWINKTWCDNLGLEVPTTTEELYTVLKAFKENDANGNGDPNDEIPLVGHTGWRGDVRLYLSNSFLYDCFSSDFGWQLNVGEDGKLVAPFMQDEWRDALVYMNKLSEEGLLSDLSFSQGQNELRAMTAAPIEQASLVGAFCGHPSPLFTGTPTDRVYEYVACPAMIGPEGVQYSPFAGWFGSYNVFITCDCENPDLAAKLLDLLSEEEASLTSRYGMRGVDWDYTDEGVVRHHLPGYGPVYELLNASSVWTEENDTIWHINTGMIPPKLHGGVCGDPYEGARAQQMDVLWYQSVPLRYDKHPEELALKLIYTADEIDQINDIQTSIRSYVDEAKTAFILGTRDIETEWEAFKAEVEAIGLQQYMEVAQAAYDRLK